MRLDAQPHSIKVAVEQLGAASTVQVERSSVSAVAVAISAAVTRLGMSAAVLPEYLALGVTVSPINLAYELGKFILRTNILDPVHAGDGAGVLSELFNSFFKSLTNNAEFSDHVARQFHKDLKDGAGFTDAKIYAFFKALADQAAVSDAPALSVARPAADAFEVMEASFRSFGKYLTEEVGASEDEVVEFFKVLSENPAVNDAAALALDKPLAHTAGVADAAANAFAKYLYDQIIVTDDIDGSASILDDQHMEFVKGKTDLVGVTDVIQLIFLVIRVFEDTAAVGDALALDLAKPIDDAAGVSSLTELDVAKAVSDAAAFIDAAILESSKVSNDVASLVDSKDISYNKPTTDSALVSDTGSVRNQNYCGPDYFAEDFVGTAQTFD